MMAPLMKSELLRQQHKKILELAADVTRLLTSPDATVAAASSIRTILNTLTTILLAHLEIEDNQVYPELQKRPNPECSGTAHKYQQEMGGLATAYVDFIDA